MRRIACFLLFFLTCGTLSVAPDPSPARPVRHFHPTINADTLIPGPNYPEIFRTAEACTGVLGDYSKIVWRSQPGNSFTSDWGAAIGQWVTPDTIVLAKEYAGTSWVVKHEMIHYLLQRGHSEPERLFIWGFLCQATWEFIPQDPDYKP